MHVLPFMSLSQTSGLLFAQMIGGNISEKINKAEPLLIKLLLVIKINTLKNSQKLRQFVHNQLYCTKINGLSHFESNVKCYENLKLHNCKLFVFDIAIAGSKKTLLHKEGTRYKLHSFILFIVSKLQVTYVTKMTFCKTKTCIYHPRVLF